MADTIAGRSLHFVGGYGMEGLPTKQNKKKGPRKRPFSVSIVALSAR